MTTAAPAELSPLEAQLKRARALSRLGSDHLVGGKFTPKPGGYSSHHPYSKELYDRLPTLDGVVSKTAAVGTTMKKVLTEILNRLSFKTVVPISASQVATRALAHSFDWQECSAPVAGAKWEYTPLPLLTYGMEVAYSPSLGYDASCAVLLQIAQKGWLGGQLVNMREIEPGQLVCITLTMDLSSIFPEGGVTPVHLWINKSRTRTTGPGGNTPHLGVQGGSLFSLCALSLAPLGIRVDYAGRTFLKLLVRGKPLEVQLSFGMLPREPGLRPLDLAGWRIEGVGACIRRVMQSHGLYGDAVMGNGNYPQVDALRALGVYYGGSLPLSPASFTAFGAAPFPKLTQESAKDTIEYLSWMRRSMAREMRTKLAIGPSLRWGEYLQGTDLIPPTEGDGNPFGGHLPFRHATYRPRHDDLDVSIGALMQASETALTQISKVLTETHRPLQPELSRLREMAR